MLVLSLFPGIGLLDRAFEEEGFTVVRGPDLLWGGDIRRFHPPAGRFDGVIGGPPCPDFSPLRYLIAAHGYTSRHGNLIPEFERCVAEAQPTWFLMEEGPLAPDAVIEGYAQHGFYLSPTWLGEEQSRRRKFCFGIKGGLPVDLRQWIEYAVFQPMVAAGAILADCDDLGFNLGVRQVAVTHHADPYPVQRGGNGKIKRSALLASGQPTYEEDGRVKKRPRRSWEESCRLQGLPPDFLDEAPFTLTGKREVLGNGVPLPMGRAIAKAIRRAVEVMP